VLLKKRIAVLGLLMLF